jgi:hypothetical protein
MWFDEIVPLLPYIRDVGGTKQTECPRCKGHAILEPFSEDHRQGNVKCIGTRGLNKCDWKDLNAFLNRMVAESYQSCIAEKPEVVQTWPGVEENGHPPPDWKPPIATNEPAPMFRFLEEEELCALPPPIWQVEDLFQEESFIQVFGQSNHTKSLFALDLALHKCAGTETWFGRKILKPGPVVWVNADGGRGLTMRVNAWREHYGTQRKFRFRTLMGNVQLNKADQMAVFTRMLTQMDPRPVFVVFDTLSRCIPGVDENATGEMTRVTEQCHRLKLATGATICLIHHTDKTGQWDRGSSVVKSETDTQIRVTKDELSGISTVSSRKTRESDPFKDFYFRLQRVADSVVIVPHTMQATETPAERKEASIEEVKLVIDTKPGVTRPQIELMLNLAKTTVARHVDELMRRMDVIELEAPWTPGSKGRLPKGLYPRSTQGELDPPNLLP